MLNIVISIRGMSAAHLACLRLCERLVGSSTPGPHQHCAGAQWHRRALGSQPTTIRALLLWMSSDGGYFFFFNVDQIGKIPDIKKNCYIHKVYVFIFVDYTAALCSWELGMPRAMPSHCLLLTYLASH